MKWAWLEFNGREKAEKFWLDFLNSQRRIIPHNNWIFRYQFISKYHSLTIITNCCVYQVQNEKCPSQSRHAHDGGNAIANAAPPRTFTVIGHNLVYSPTTCAYIPTQSLVPSTLSLPSPTFSISLCSTQSHQLILSHNLDPDFPDFGLNFFAPTRRTPIGRHLLRLHQLLFSYSVLSDAILSQSSGVRNHNSRVTSACDIGSNSKPPSAQSWIS